MGLYLSVASKVRSLVIEFFGDLSIGGLLVMAVSA